ncbi:type IV toxin-antitoxin system AbiEi family antitoxin domain-containing protein [Patulibacter sp. S7RM1-6]
MDRALPPCRPPARGETEGARAMRAIGEHSRLDGARWGQMRAGARVADLPPDLRSDRAVAWFAARQHGVVSREQLGACGLSRHAIRRRVEAGRLHRLHPTAFAVGSSSPPADGRRLAAVLACGVGALLSHESAGAHWGLEGCRDDEPAVTVVGRDARVPGIEAHRVRALDPRDVRWRGTVPLTAPSRTVIDLAPRRSAVEVERLLADVWTAGLATERDLRAAAHRAPRRRGTRLLLAALDDGAPRTRSEAERALQALVRRAALPRPRTNVHVAGFEVDAYWPDVRLVVEVDSWRFHGSRRAFEDDRRRRWRLQQSGVRVEHVTWRQLTQRPEETVALLAVAIAQGVAGPPFRYPDRGVPGPSRPVPTARPPPPATLAP